MEKIINEVNKEEVTVKITESELNDICAKVVAEIAGEFSKDVLMVIFLGGVIVTKIQEKIFHDKNDKEEQ